MDKPKKLSEAEKKELQQIEAKKKALLKTKQIVRK